MNLTALLKDSDPQPSGVREISAEAVLPHLEALRVIDVREPAEFVGPLGHLHGAELVPLSTVGSAAPAWDRSTPILVVCRSGGRSGNAASTLMRLGFEQVFNLTGGMIAWNAHELPCSFDAPGRNP